MSCTDKLENDDQWHNISSGKCKGLALELDDIQVGMLISPYDLKPIEVPGPDGVQLVKPPQGLGSWAGMPMRVIYIQNPFIIVGVANQGPGAAVFTDIPVEKDWALIRLDIRKVYLMRIDEEYARQIFSLPLEKDKTPILPKWFTPESQPLLGDEPSPGIPPFLKSGAGGDDNGKKRTPKKRKPPQFPNGFYSDDKKDNE